MKLRVATRKSKLALAQARAFVRDLIAANAANGNVIEIEEVLITTTGDRIQDRALSQIGGKGLFLKEIEEALVENAADFAVHSMKDVPADLAPGLELGCVPTRADARDVVITASGCSFSELPAGSRVGTSSLRRSVQLGAARPDLEFVPFRGNVDTRLRKLAEGVADATLLARCGLVRLGVWDEVRGETLEPEICLPAAPTDVNSLEIYMNRQADKRIQLLIPQRGEKRKFVNLANVNAEQMLFEQRIMAEKRDFIPRAVKAMQEDLRLPTSPLLIEAFDISNLHGSDSVASLVSFRKGKPWKGGYRIFKIKTVDGIDDFASIGEAVNRRYSRLKRDIAKSDNDDAERLAFPDLILIDGGKGQLSSAKRALDELNLSDVPVIGLAKRLEEIYFPGHSEPMTLPKRSSALRLLQQIRDEAHRFAVTQHRNLRGKRQIKSKIDGIPGIGPAKKQALLKEFGSLKRIAVAEASEIARVKGINLKLAESVKTKLNE